MEDLKDNDAIPPTHILKHHASEKEGWLFRANDGICVATYQELLVVFGENPNRREGRVFIDHAHARTWIEVKIANDDARAQGLAGAIVKHEQVEHTLIVPGRMLAQPGSESITKIGGKIQ